MLMSFGRRVGRKKTAATKSWQGNLEIGSKVVHVPLALKLRWCQDMAKDNTILCKPFDNREWNRSTSHRCSMFLFIISLSSLWLNISRNTLGKRLNFPGKQTERPSWAPVDRSEEGLRATAQNLIQNDLLRFLTIQTERTREKKKT